MPYPTGYGADQPLDLGMTSGDGTAVGLRRAMQIIQGGPTFADLGGSPQKPLPGTGWISVKAWGAVGDSVTDDTAACRAALAAVPFRGTLYFPAGMYSMTAGLTLPGHNITIRGEGAGSILNCLFGGVSANDFAISANNVDDIVIQDLTIGGTHAGGVSYFSGARCKIRRLYISGATLLNTQSFCAGIYAQDNSQLVIEDCVLSGNGRVTGEGHGDIVCNLGTYQTINSRIVNNRCLSTMVNYNICLFDPRGVLVQGNECTGAIESPVSADRHGYGILLYRTESVAASLVGECTVVDNYVHDTRGTGIYLQSIRDSTVANNIVRNTGAGQSTATLSVAGITIETGTAGAGVTVTGNRVYSSSKDGISISSSTRTTVVGNAVSGSAMNGISVRGPCTDIVISSNMVSETTGGNAITSFSDVAALRVHISDNVIRSRVTPALGWGIYAAPLTEEWTIVDNDVSDYDAGNGFVLQGLKMSASGNKQDGNPHLEGCSLDRGDANVTLTAVDRFTQRFATALTANRTVTLPTNPLKNGRYRISRTGLGAFTLDVGGLKTIPSATAAFVDVEYDTTVNGWRLVAYGTL